jgi:hypothetical protein
VKPIAAITDGADTEIGSPSSIALDSTGQIYVTDNTSVMTYSVATKRNTPPLFRIRGDRTQLRHPVAIALDSHKDIYVANWSIGPNDDGTLTVYRAGSNGNVAPNRTIDTGAKSGPNGIAVDGNRNIYVLVSTGPRTGKADIVIYPPDDHDKTALVAVVRDVGFRPASVNNVLPWNGLALDSTGRIYIVNPASVSGDGGSIEIYPSLANLRRAPGYPEIKPLATIDGSRTSLAHPEALAFDRSDRLYVLNANQWNGQPGDYSSITVYPALGDRSGNLDEPPLATIIGANAKLDMGPVGIAVWDPVVH